MSTLPKVNLYARVVLGVALGALLVFAFQPYDLWPLAIVVVAGFALLVRGQPARRSALLGLAVGLGFFVPFLPWIGAEVGPIPWLLLAFAQALFFVPLGVVVAVQQRVAGWPIWTAAAWVAMEAVRGRIPYGGFTWGKLAFSQVSGPLMDLAAIGGSVLVSFAVALMGGLLAWAALPRPGMHRLLAVASAAAVLGSGVLVEPPAPDGPSVTVAVVQGNVPRAGLRFNAEKRVILTNHVEATQQLAADIDAGRVPHPDVVIWPENSSDINPFADAAARSAIDDAARAVDAPILVGTLVPTADQRNIENTSIVWDPVSGPGETYVKRHPMPFGEYIPFRNIARLITAAVDQQPRDFVAGQKVGLLHVGPVKIGPVICFEVAFDNLVRDAVRAGGEILTVQTNNATFGYSPMSEQQLAMARLRAVEHGRAVLVSALSGISAVIEPDGTVHEQTELYTQDVLVAEVPTSDRQSLATIIGEWPEWLLVLVALSAFGFALWRSRRPAATTEATGTAPADAEPVSADAR